MLGYALIAIGGIATAMIGGIHLGHYLGVKETEARWRNAVMRAGVSAVHRCGLCGYPRGEGK